MKQLHLTSAYPCMSNHTFIQLSLLTPKLCLTSESKKITEQWMLLRFFYREKINSICIIEKCVRLSQNKSQIFIFTKWPKSYLEEKITHDYEISHKFAVICKIILKCTYTKLIYKDRKQIFLLNYKYLGEECNLKFFLKIIINKVIKAFTKFEIQILKIIKSIIDNVIYSWVVLKCLHFTFLYAILKIIFSFYYFIN